MGEECVKHCKGAEYIFISLFEQSTWASVSSAAIKKQYQSVKLAIK